MIADVNIQQGLDQAWKNVATFVPKFLGFFLILLIGWFVAKALSKLTNSLLERVGFDTWVERGALKTAFDQGQDRCLRRDRGDRVLDGLSVRPAARVRRVGTKPDQRHDPGRHLATCRT